ncbi:MAG: hypothetical protein IPP48_06200 [Chitinophagaceae bacterium]|nr:hypothetical protein [Chitinophagaceae bacterium]
MTANNDKKYGRTFFDFIAEHPKLTFFSFLTLLLVAIVLIFLRVPFKVGSLEVGDKPVVHDTIVETKTDTQYIDKSTIVIKQAPPTRPTKDPTKSISVKSGDTIVTVQNQPANINTGTNNGIIGNNNDVKVNVNEIQRKLNEPSKQQLLQLIYQTIEQKNITDSCIEVSAMAGNNEALIFATEILQFLKEQNLKASGIGQFQRAPVVKGVEIGASQFNKKCVTISVGYRQ